FFTKTDARTWLASVHTKISRGEWEPPEVRAARLRAEAEAEQARLIGFAEYANRWIEQIRTQPNRSGKKRAMGKGQSYQSKVAAARGACRSSSRRGRSGAGAVDRVRRVREPVDRADPHTTEPQRQEARAGNGAFLQEQGRRLPDPRVRRHPSEGDRRSAHPRH